MSAPAFCDRCGEVDSYCTCPAADPAADIDRGQYDDPGPEEPGPADDPAPSSPSAEPWTELGCARRLAARFGGRLRHIGAWGKWLVWDERRWAVDSTGQPARWAKVIARGLTNEAMAIADDNTRKAKLALARKLESAASIRGVLHLASSEPGIAITPDDVDADPFLLNCTNGTVDLRTLTLHPHDPADLLTKMTGAAYDPRAAGTEWDEFLARVQPDEAMRTYLARLTGHALEGRVTAHLLPIFAGSGANGKSTYVNAVTAALGDYAGPADPDLLTARTFDAHPTGVADLFGKRLAILHETDAGRRLAEGTVKRLTGGDRIKARRMREDFWSFEPSHTFLMLTNHRPLVSGQDEGIWRRLRLVPWDVVIPVDQRDEELGDRLALELDAILTWLVSGYRGWKTEDL
jgi:putative DNA primase/helicase